jgi:hypothetical protein
VISGIGARLLLLKQYFNYPTRISPMTRMARSSRTDSRDQRDRRSALVDPAFGTDACKHARLIRVAGTKTTVL